MTPGWQLLRAAALVAAILTVGILGYVGGSFVLMRAHVEPRPMATALREALREIAWAALTQPLLPLHYFVGRRMAPGKGIPVVAIHGYTQNRVDFLFLARACRRAGIGPVFGFNYPWFATIHGNAERLARFVEDVRRETGAAVVDLVAHSLGGLVAMEYICGPGQDRVRRLVTIASPHAGVVWQGPIPALGGSAMRAGAPFMLERAARQVPVPCLSIYSTHDNVVHPPATSALAHRGASDRAVDHLSHLAILFDQEVAREVVEFLGAG